MRAGDRRREPEAPARGGRAAPPRERRDTPEPRPARAGEPAKRHANTGRGRSGLRSTAAGAGPLPAPTPVASKAGEGRHAGRPCADCQAQAAFASERLVATASVGPPQTSRLPSRRIKDDASSALAATVRIARLSAFSTLSQEAR